MYNRQKNCKDQTVTKVVHETIRLNSFTCNEILQSETSFSSATYKARNLAIVCRLEKFILNKLKTKFIMTYTKSEKGSEVQEALLYHRKVSE